MPEALETWPVTLFEKLLPRHLQIIFEINHRFLEEVARRWPDKNHLLSSLSLIDEHHDKQIRMANLAIVGSHRVNGVAWLHSELVKKQLVPDFYFMTPEKFINQTNGVTPRRWVQQANPGLAAFCTNSWGKGGQPIYPCCPVWKAWPMILLLLIISGPLNLPTKPRSAAGRSTLWHRPRSAGDV